MLSVVLLFVLGLVLICLGGDKLVDAAVAISRKIGIPQIVVGATIVSIGTTLPEILVSTTAALQGAAEISAGNAFGSIICNTALIAGLCQLIRPTTKVEKGSIRWRGVFFLAVSVFLIIAGFVSGAYGRLVGILLIALFCIYSWISVLRSKVEEEGEEDADEEDLENISLVKNFAILAVCAILLYFGANLLVDNGVMIASELGVSERVIAVTFIALGTSLPELVTSVTSIIKGYGNVGLGNIIGANLLNMLLVIGIPAAIGGIPLQSQTYMVDAPLGTLAMMILVVPMMIRKKGSRIQGLILLAGYVIYCIASFA